VADVFKAAAFLTSALPAPGMRVSGATKIVPEWNTSSPGHVLFIQKTGPPEPQTLRGILLCVQGSRGHSWRPWPGPRGHPASLTGCAPRVFTPRVTEWPYRLQTGLVSPDCGWASADA